jgi:hypothetical protein
MHVYFSMWRALILVHCKQNLYRWRQISLNRQNTGFCEHLLSIAQDVTLAWLSGQSKK